MTIFVTHLVKADNQIEAGATAYLLLPAGHRQGARLESCTPFRWMPNRWDVTFCLTTMDVAEAIVPDHFSPDPKEAA